VVASLNNFKSEEYSRYSLSGIGRGKSFIDRWGECTGVGVGQHA